MKKVSRILLFTLTAFFSFATQMNAQIQKPTGRPGEVELPTPKIKPLNPPDLTVTGITFVSIELTPQKYYIIKVIATTKNNGQLKSVKTQLQGYFKTPSGGGTWKECGSAGNVSSIDPGKTYSAVYTFKASALEVGGIPFDFRVKTDSGNFVAETDETNNFSEVIIVSPRSN